MVRPGDRADQGDAARRLPASALRSPPAAPHRGQGAAGTDGPRLPKRHRRFGRRLLGSIVPWQRWGIADARPRGWRLYFKGGWGIADDGVGTVNHQVAFLERGHCRIALAILTEHNPSTADGAETQRGVAERLLRGIRRAPCGVLAVR